MMAIEGVQTTRIKKAPAFTDHHASKYLKRGFEALMKKDFNDASACANLVLKYKPKLHEGHFLVGLIAIEVSEWGAAKKAFSIVISLKKDHAAAWAQLSRIHAKTGSFNAAEESLQKAVEFGSEDPLVLDVIGAVYTLMGDQEAALKCFEASCKDTQDVSFLMNKGRCLLYLGKFKEAREALDLVLKLSPQITAAHFTMSRLEKATSIDHINEMLGLLEKYKKDAPPTSSLYFGMGKEYEDLEMWPEAIEAYENGTRIRRKGITYNETEEIDAFESLKETFTKEWLDNSEEGCLDASPIFIIGQPRTGTTLTERILTARDDIHSAGELPQFGMNLKKMAGTAQSHMIAKETVLKASSINLKALGEAYMETTRSLRSGLPHFVDKLPLNYLYAPVIAAALPNAKIIHVTRDPMDSCFSSYKQLFAEAYYHSYNQGEMARHHCRYRKLMEHYRSVLGDRMLDVAYEEVVVDLEAQARRITEFLGLDWQDASLEFHKQKTAVTTASAAQVREKAHSRSVGKWKRFEKELAPMKDILLKEGVLEL